MAFHTATQIELEVWGEYACFTRPENKAERVSYSVPTPSALRGVLEAIYWKPEIRWVIQEIHVLEPIRWMSIRRNEVGGKASVRSPIYIEDQRQQRSTLLLRNVRYGIVAHFSVLPSHKPGGEDGTTVLCEKHRAIFERRAARGQHFHQPYLGCREFVAGYRLANGGFGPCRLPESQRNQDLGWMLHDINYPAQPAHMHSAEMFRAKLVNGVIYVPELRRLS